MDSGVVKRQRVMWALVHLGGTARPKGGETLYSFPGTTIIVGRHDFSRAMLCRLERKLARAGINGTQLRRTLDRA